jgi:hypothetical protein
VRGWKTLGPRSRARGKVDEVLIRLVEARLMSERRKKGAE